MYIKVTQYGKMQRAFVGAVRNCGSFVRFVFYHSVYLLTVCVFLYDNVLFSGKCI